MNHVYRLVWNPTLNALVAVCESARGRGKSGGKAASTPALMVSFLIAACAVPAGAVGLNELPTGGQVSAGAASISNAANTLTVNQSSQRAAINWQSFSVGSGAKVNFVQPNASSVVLNRVMGTEQSMIAGAMNANGQVFLLNSNGVLFTGTSSVNVGGLVASTLNLSDADFMAGRNTFLANVSKASVINLGNINTADGGYVALLGNQVSNQGVITAKLGTAILAAGDNISLNFNGDSLVGVSINQGTLNALVENKQAIYADGGTVILTAQGLDMVMATVVNNTGEVRAQTVANKEGKIYLLGEGGVVNVDGRLDASAPGSGKGGFIETSGPRVKITDTAHITTASSLGLSGSWLIDPVDFTIAATGGDITGTALSTALGAGGVTIQTATGGITCTGVTGCGAGTGTNGDIFVNDAVNWSVNTTLSLNAYRNININSPITATGQTGAVALYYGQGAVNSGNTASYTINAPIDLMAGNNFFTRLGNDVSAITYKVITSLGQQGDATSAPSTMTLQGMAASSSLGGKYVLGSNIDACATGGNCASGATTAWNSGAGLTPIGNSTTKFTGIFDGLGHTITNLTINQPSDNVGLFGYSNNGVIRNVELVAASVTGQRQVGGLVGYNYGTISNSSTTGTVLGTGGNTGGLVGFNQGVISNSYANVTVTGTLGNTGGLVGDNYNAVNSSYATGAVNGIGQVGGLVGGNENGHTISNSYASGLVTGTTDVGGLVGRNASGIINHSYSISRVIGTTSVGAFIGNYTGVSASTLFDNFYDDSINGVMPGLGNSGNFTAPGNVWGMITAAMKTQSSFTRWDVTSPVWRINGYPCLAWSASCISTTPIYLDLISGSSVYGTTPTFGYAFYTAANGGNVVSDATPTGSVVWTGAPTAISNAGLYHLTYSSGITLSNSAYTLSPGGAVDWAVSPAPLTVTASNVSKVYGQTPTLSSFTSSGLQNSESIGSASLISAGTLATAGVNVSPYSIVASAATGGTFNANNYIITYANGGLSVTPLPIAVAANNGATQVYDGSVNAAAILLNVANAINGDTVTLSGAATLVGGNAGAQAVSSISGLTLSNPNYTLVGGSASGSVAVSAAPLTVTASSASKVYGQTPILNSFTISGLVAGQTIGSVTETSSGAAVNAGVAAGPYPIVTSAATGGSFAAGNYSISYVNGSLTVTPLPVNAAAVSGATRVYDGSANAAAILLNVANAINGDTVTLSGAATLVGGNAGAQAVSSISGLTLSNPNYTLVGGSASGSVAVSAAPLTVTASSASKTIDGLAYAGGNGVTYSGFINAETTTVLGGQLTYGGSSQGALAAGKYVITPTGLASSNYAVSFASAELVINPSTHLEETITNVIIAPKVNLPIAANDAGQPSTLVNVVASLPAIDPAFGNGARLALVFSPSANELTQAVTLSQARAMMQSLAQNGGIAPDSTSDVRVPVSHNSLAGIVNGGVKLPDGVEQQLFVVQAH